RHPASSIQHRESSIARPPEAAPKRWTRPVTFEASLMNHLNERKRHSKAFRKQAVELLLTGKTLRELGSELGISAMTICPNRQPSAVRPSQGQSNQKPGGGERSKNESTRNA